MVLGMLVLISWKEIKYCKGSSAVSIIKLSASCSPKEGSTVGDKDASVFTWSRTSRPAFQGQVG